MSDNVVNLTGFDIGQHRLVASSCDVGARAFVIIHAPTVGTQLILGVVARRRELPVEVLVGG